MEVFVIVVVAIIIWAIASNATNSNSHQQNTSPDVNFKVTASKENGYADPYLGSSIQQRSNQEKPEIFRVLHPFFHALADSSFHSMIDSKLAELANRLANIKDEDVQKAISTLVDQDYFRTKTGLPKYLQMVPINRFIEEGIFVEPDESDREEMLSSLTMKVLRKKCDEIGISAARSKAETIERLIDSGEDLNLPYSDYFMISSEVKKLYKTFDDYCLNRINQLIDKNGVKLTAVKKKLHQDELGDVEKNGKYKLQEYGYDSLVFFKNDKPLYRVLEFNLDQYRGYASLLESGLILLYKRERLGRMTIGLVLVMDENKNELFQKRLPNPNSNELKVIDDQKFVVCTMDDGKIWALRYDTFEDKYLENPNDKNIYSLLEQFSSKKAS